MDHEVVYKDIRETERAVLGIMRAPKSGAHKRMTKSPAPVIKMRIFFHGNIIIHLKSLLF